MNLFLKILKWFSVTLLVLFVCVVVYRGFVLNNQKKTDAVVERIHSMKISMADVMGENLPPAPGEAADATVAGVDANGNGIRDDVELAIFEKYPNSAKKRAVSLQYALALQMEFTQPFSNTDIVVAILQEQSRADSCLADELVPRSTPESSRKYSDLEKIDEYIDFIKEIQINTEDRRKANDTFYDLIGSYSSLDDYCDIDYTKLPN